MWTTLIAALSLTSAAPAAIPLSPVSSDLRDSRLALSPRTLENYLRFIAGDETTGRMTLSPGIDKCAAYIVEQFKKAGVQPGGTDGTYFHEYDVTANQRPTKNNVLAFSLGGGKRLSPEIGKDYVPLVGSDSMKLVNATMVYVGYGLDESDWKDYEGVDVQGKVALALRGVPEGRTPRSNGWKARTAKEKGAAAIVFVGPSAPGRSELPAYTPGQGIPSSTGIVAAAIHSKLLKDLAGIPYSEARAAKAPASKSLGVVAKIVTELERNQGMAKNVIGVVPGKDPALRGEYLILGAHYDHLGRGEIASRTGSDAIHYGADDNGSGTTLVVALAEHFAKTRSNRRTLIFQLYSGEEMGLLGSRAWANDPANEATLKATTAMINMDMVGRVRNDTVYVYGASTSAGWNDVLDAVRVEGLKLDVNPHTRGDSDHATFGRKSLPVLFFHTGLHNEYHSEKDTIDGINFQGMAQVGEAIIQVVDGLDKLQKKLEWNPQADLGGKPTDRRIPPIR